MGYKQLALIVCSISKSIFTLNICSMLTSENLIWGKWIFPSQIIAIYIHLYNLVNVDKWKSYDRQSLSSPPPPPWSQDGSHCHPPEILDHDLCQLFHLVRILAIRSATSPRLDLSETITKWRWLPEEGNAMIHARELRGGICPCRQCRRQCKIFASGVNFSIFTHFLCFFLLKPLKLGEIDGVKFFPENPTV